VRETPDAVTVFIEPVAGGAMAWRAGQYLTHCFTVKGQKLRRAYSMSQAQSSSTADLAFTCKAVGAGRVSQYIGHQLAVGDEYEVRGPSGEFCLSATQTPLVFIAGGSGITPVISLLETALREQPDRSAYLVYASRNQAHLLFGSRLESLTQQYPNLRVISVLTQPASTWSGERGHLDAARLLALVPAVHCSDAHWYLCGPMALMDALEPALKDAGVVAERLHRENFRSVNHAAAAHPDSPQAIRFLRSGVTIQQQPGQTILDAALANGIALDFSCTVGGCAACKIKLNDGPITMDEPNCLSEAERAQGFALACSAYALGAIEVEA
jgi:ring-1,2-phenylacetyl-CoA epoxidase subunit PaaE